MFNGILAWGKSKRYTDESLIGVGALKGSPATVDDYEIDPDTGDTTITFAWEDTTGGTHTSDVVVKRGAQGVQGVQGVQGIQGIKGDAPTVTATVDNVYDYRLSFVGATSVTTPNLKGNSWFFGTEITSTDEAGVTAIIENSKLYDLYLNTNTDNLYRRTDFNPVVRQEVQNHWVKIGTLQGKEGLNAYRTWLTIPGNEGKTIMQWVEETSGQSYAIQKVWEKPNILDPDTELNVWYFYKTGKQMDPNKFQQKLFSANLTKGYDVGDKLAFKIVDGEDTYWIPATLGTAIAAPETGHTRFFQLTFCNPTLFTVSDYTDDLYDAQLVMSNGTETAGITQSGCPYGYTEIVLSVQPMSNDAWKYISSPIDGPLEPGIYAYWNGVKYIILEIAISGQPRPGYQPILMWDEQRNIGMLWSYNTAGDFYALAYPFFTKTTLSDHVPTGVVDMSDMCDLIQLGTWNQTIYVSPSGSRLDANEVTIATGADFAGVVMQSTFDAVVGTGDMHTEAGTVKGAINEINDILRNDTTDTLDTEAQTVFGAINELHADMFDKRFEDTDENKLLLIKPKTIGTETVYEPQAVSKVPILVDAGSNHTIEFGVTADGKAGYKLDGADTVTPFKSVAGTITITENTGSTPLDISQYAEAIVNVGGSLPTGIDPIGRGGSRNFDKPVILFARGTSGTISFSNHNSVSVTVTYASAASEARTFSIGANMDRRESAVSNGALYILPANLSVEFGTNISGNYIEL